MSQLQSTISSMSDSIQNQIRSNKVEVNISRHLSMKTLLIYPEILPDSMFGVPRSLSGLNMIHGPTMFEGVGLIFKCHQMSTSYRVLHVSGHVFTYLEPRSTPEIVWMHWGSGYHPLRHLLPGKRHNRYSSRPTSICPIDRALLFTVECLLDGCSPNWCDRVYP